ncbi:MAG: ABC transporter substrate-binding protein [Chloroflexi bacterium]|nr:ABC transporter substrate-binding protein [Chloroflexota bacterium]
MRNKLVSMLALGLLVFAACSSAAPAATPTTPPRATPTTAARAAPAATAIPTATGATGQPTAAPVASPTPPPATAAPKADQPQSGGMLKARWRRQVVTFEPHKRGFLGSDGSMVYDIIYTPLAQRQPAGPCQFSVGPEGAESWKWTNDTTLEVKLRPDLKFVDKPPVNGRMATADDVIWGLQRYREFQSRGAIAMKPITSITAVDPLTIRFTMESPYPAIVDSVFANHYGGLILPKEVEKDGQIDHTGWLGTGPFYLKEWVNAVKLVIERNPNYYKQGLPYMDGIEWILLTDVATALAAMRAGKVELWARDLAYPQAAPFLNSDIKVLSCLETAPSIWFMRTDKKPFDDIRVRRALAMAVDREGLVKSVMQGRGTVIGYAAPAHNWMLKVDEYPPEVRRYLEFHPDESKKLLAEAGYTSGFEALMEFDPTVASIYNQNLEGLVDMWSRVGVKLKLKSLPRGEYQERITNSANYQEMAESRTMDIDPYYFLSFLHSEAGGGTNKSYVNDPALDKLIDDFRSTVDMNRAKDLARQIQVRIVDQAYVVRAPSHDDFRLLGPRVRGFPLIDSMTTQMSLAWAEKMWLAR